MIEPSMYIGIGFLLGALVGLLFVPTVHTRAVRLTVKRLARDVPESLADIDAAKALARAEFAIATRLMEMKLERIWAKSIADARQVAKKEKIINQQNNEICALQVRLAAVERNRGDGEISNCAWMEFPPLAMIQPAVPGKQRDGRLRLVTDTPDVSS